MVVYYPKNRDFFEKTLSEELAKRFEYRNKIMVPCISKIVIASCFNKSKYSDQDIAHGFKALALLTGSKPVFTRAKKSVAAFKVREKEIVGVKVTLRKIKMWEFFQRMVSVYLPRVRKFKKIKSSSFSDGSFTIGIEDINSFPEITSELTLKRFGISINLVFSSKRKRKISKEEIAFFLDRYGLVVK